MSTWPPPICPRPLSPDLARRFDDAFELAFLIVLANQFTCDVGCEPALRADRELLEPDVFGGGVDPSLQIVDRLELGHLGTDQPEHNDLALGHEAQRLEPAGAR